MVGCRILHNYTHGRLFRKSTMTSAEKRRLSVFVRRLAHVVVLCFGFFVNRKVHSASPFFTSCNEYTTENETASCNCRSMDCPSANFSLRWLNAGTLTHTLSLIRVTKEDNGRQFVCQLNCAGEISNATYTVKVAYGPYTDKMSITGNMPFITDGTRVLNLTCQATDVSPTTEYSWTDSLCKNNSSTCSFVPKQPGDDGKTVTCRAFNKHTLIAAEKELVLDLRYNVSITGDVPFITNGTRVLNLTCRTTYVSYTPEYAWTDSLCRNSSSTCSIVPKPPGDDGKTVRCRAFNKHTLGVSEKDLVLRLTYPPLAPPDITASTLGILSCTVTGGNPLVQSVQFRCMNQQHIDRADTVTRTSVTSSLTVDTSQASNTDNMTCYCSAYWSPEPDLYSERSVVTFQFDDDVSITGDVPFITNGTRVLNLTCRTTDVSSTPEYSWTDSLCRNSSSTCSFVPKPPGDDGKTVTCRAFNKHTLRVSEKDLVLRLTYPPLTPPKITPITRLNLKERGTLSCTVTGGNPLVQSVDFRCMNPQHIYRADTVTNTSVTSSLTVDTSQASDTDKMTCYCSAYWPPEPDLYSGRSVATFQTDVVRRAVNRRLVPYGIISGLLLLLPVGVAASVVIRTCINRLKDRTPTNRERMDNTTNIGDQPNTSEDSTDLNQAGIGGTTLVVSPVPIQGSAGVSASSIGLSLNDSQSVEVSTEGSSQC